MINDKISHGLAHSLANFLDKRHIVCEVKGVRSRCQELPIGCVQGSILGPRLFTLYMGGLCEAIGHSEVVGYADDTYVVIGGDSFDDIKEKLKEISKKPVRFLKNLGMVVNTTKTELLMFGTRDLMKVTFDGSELETTKSLKALGVIISNDLSWNEHLDSIIPKSQAKLSLLRKIRPWLSMGQFLQIATSQVFSTAYYASTVWLNDTLSYKYWKKVESFHYRVMRVACNDFKGRRKRKLIDAQCKRATPRMWSQYISTSMVMKILRDDVPSILANSILGNMVTERRRPRHGRFFDCSKKRIGKHSFANRLTHLNNLIEPWLYPSPSDASIRTMLKTFFNFDFK